MKSEEGDTETAAAGDVPTVGEEGEAAEGEGENETEGGSKSE